MFWEKSIVIVFLVVTLVSFVPMVSYAVVPVLLPFGGKIVSTIPCTFPPGLALFIGPPRKGAFLYVPKASILFAWYKPIIGSSVVGKYVTLSGCVVGVCPACYFQPLLGTIKMLGTSLF